MKNKDDKSDNKQQLLQHVQHIQTLYQLLFLLFVCHLLSVLIFYFYYSSWMYIPYFWLLIFRFIIGMCIGGIDTVITLMVGYWFEGNENNISLAFGILLTMLELGLVIGRYMQPWLITVIGTPLSMLFGLIIVGAAIIALFGIDCCIIRTHRQNADFSNSVVNANNETGNSGDEDEDEDEDDKTEITFVNQFMLLKQVSLKAWLGIILFTCMQLIAGVLYSCMIEPYVVIYGFSESYSDYLWSIVEWVDAGCLIMFSKVIDYFGAYIEGSTIMFTTWLIASILVLFSTSPIAVCIFSGIGFVGGSCGFTVLVLSSDNPQSTPMVIAFATSAGWIAGLLAINAFGWIYDATRSYNISMILLVASGVVALLVCLILYIIDSKKNDQAAAKMHFSKKSKQEDK